MFLRGLHSKLSPRALRPCKVNERIAREKSAANARARFILAQTIQTIGLAPMYL